MYSLIAAFFAIPLYFSHIFSSFGVIIGNSGSFERQKVYLFTLLICMAIVELGIERGKTILQIIQKYWYGIVLMMSIPFFSIYHWGVPLSDSFFLGSMEKHHGYIWYVLLIILGILIASLNSREKYTLVRTSVLASCLVALFSFLELILDRSLFIAQVLTPVWGDVRSVSTLGNPNYVAGYLLMHIPLLFTLRTPNRGFYGILLFLGLLATGSYIGIGLTIFYVLYRLTREFLGTQRALYCVIGIGIIGVYFALGLIDPEKLLSLKSRFILMRELGTVMVQYPLSFFLGFGPESIITYFEGARSLIINNYFPQTSAIDSSHNIFLDFLFQYGIFPLLGMAYLVYQSAKKLTLAGKEGFILGLLFLSLNVVVTSHVVVLLLLATFTRDIKEAKK